MPSMLMVRADQRAQRVEQYIVELRRLPLTQQQETLLTEASAALLPAMVLNRESRRVRREILQANHQIERLRLPCHCARCRGKRRWPSYYAPSLISFECYLEGQAINSDLDDQLKALRGRSGSVVLEVPTKFRGKNRAILA